MFCSQLAFGQTDVDKAGSNQVRAEVLATGLSNPCGIVVHGDGVFISQSGIGEVSWFADGILTPAIVNFETEKYGRSPGFLMGPLGLALSESGALVVGEGGQTAGEDRIASFDLEPNFPAANWPLNANEPTSQVSLAASKSFAGEGNFYGLANSANGILFTCQGDDVKGWIGNAEWNDGCLLYTSPSPRDS